MSSADHDSGAKAPDAFRTISEVAADLDLPQHVLRFWETRFAQIRPMKRGGGRRYYRPDDVGLLRGIRQLLYGQGYTIKGVQRILKERGPRVVIAIGLGEADVGTAAGSQRAGRQPEPLPPAARQGQPLPPPDDYYEDEAGLEQAAEADLAAVADENDEGPVPEGYEDGYAVELEEQARRAEEAARAGERLMPRVTRFIEKLRPEGREAGPGLSRDDSRRLHATLADLLECKRLLDQVR